MGVNGKVFDDRTSGVRTLKVSEYEPPLGPELGTPFDDDTVFGDFQNGKVFDYDTWSAKDVAEMLDRDGKAKTVEQALTLPIRRTPWDIVPAEDGQADDAELIKKILDTPANAGGMSVPMAHVIGQATSAFGYRKAFFEKVFKIIESGELEGMIGFDKIAWRPATTCQIARDSRTGGFAGFRQRPRIFDQDDMRQMVDWIMIDPARAWVYIHGQHRDPMRGYSDLQIPLWCYRTKNKLRFLWYTFLEGQAIPKAIVSDKDANKAKQAAAKLRYLKNSGVIALESSTSVDPYESSGKGAEQFIEAINFLDSEMSGSVLAGFLDLPAKAAGGTGSYALSKDSSDFFLKSRQAVLEELEQDINSYLISDLAKWNLGSRPAPRFKFGQLAEADVADALQLLTAMASSTANNLPAEFTYELAAKAAEYLDLDVDKLHASFEQHAKEKEEQAKAMAAQMNNPMMAAAVQKGTIKPEVAKHMSAKAGQVGRVAGAVDKATQVVRKAQAGAKLSEYGRERMIIDLAGKMLDQQTEERTLYFSEQGLADVPASLLFDDEGAPAELVRLPQGEGREIELAAVNGHHVPGTAYHWFHEWRPRYAAVAARYRKGKHLVDKLTQEGKIHPVEPDWYQGLKPGEKTFKEIGKSSGHTTKSKLMPRKAADIKPGMGTAGGKVVAVNPSSNGGAWVTIKPNDGGPEYPTYLGKSSVLYTSTSSQTISLQPPHSISGGTEGGSKLPFEGKGQTSKPAKKVIEEAEEHFTKKGDPDAPTPAAKLNVAKKKQADHEKAVAEEQELAKRVEAEKKAYQSAKSLMADGTIPEDELKGLIDGIPDDSTPYMLAKRKGYKKALAEHLQKKQAAAEHAEQVDKNYQGMKKLLDSHLSFAQLDDLIKNLESDPNPTPAKKAKIEGFKKAQAEQKAAHEAEKAKTAQAEEKSYTLTLNGLNGGTPPSYYEETIDAVKGVDNPTNKAAVAGMKKALADYKAAHPSESVKYSSLAMAAQKAHKDAQASGKGQAIYLNPNGPHWTIGSLSDSPGEGHELVGHFSPDGVWHKQAGGASTPAAKTTSEIVGHPGWKTKTAAINNAKKKAQAEGVNYFAFQGDDGKWYITKDKSKVSNWHIKEGVGHKGQPAQVAKPWGAVQPFDPSYDSKSHAPAPSTSHSASSGSKSYPPGKKLPKGEPTGKPLKKGGTYEINKLPPVDMAAPVEGQALWGTQGQAKLTVDWWNVHHQPNLTPGQKAAATYYSTSSGANAMNFHLRGEIAADAKTRKAIQQLDSAMQPLPTTVQVSRGMSNADFWPDGDLTGETVRDLGYGSTSMTAGFGGKVQMHITIPAGIKVMPMKDLSNHQHENELLLQRGVGYKVTGDFIDNNGVRHVTAVAVPPPDPDPYDPMKG